MEERKQKDIQSGLDSESHGLIRFFQPKSSHEIVINIIDFQKLFDSNTVNRSGTYLKKKKVNESSYEVQAKVKSW